MEVRTQSKETGKGTGVYTKGAQRREALLNTTAALLVEHDLDELSLKDIAEHAGIPVGSAYHFFANAHAVYAGLAQRFMHELHTAIAAPYANKALRSWQTLFDAAIDRGAALYAANPAYRKLIIGGKAPPEIKLADRENDELIGALLLEMIGRHFEVKKTEALQRALFYAVEIVDLMFSLSVLRQGDITPAMQQEAKTAAKAYLGEYLGELQRKQHS